MQEKPLPAPAESPTLHEAQALVDAWIKTYGVRYFSELTNMACLTEEVGELARIIARRYGDQSFRPAKRKIRPTRWLIFCGYSSAWPTKPEQTSARHFGATLRRRRSAMARGI